MNDEMDPAPIRLKRLMKRAGLKRPGLAKLMGYKTPSGLQRYESVADHPAMFFNLKFVNKLAPVLVGRGNPPISSEEIYSLAGIQQIVKEAGSPSPKAETVHAPSDDLNLGRPVAFEPIPIPYSSQMTKDIPVIGVTMGGPGDADFSFNGSVVEYVRRPPGLERVTGAFALYVQGDSMSPRFESGDLVLVHPGRPPRGGDDVVVELHSLDETGEPGPCYIKRLVRRDGERLILRQFRDDREIVIPLKHVKRLYKIMTPGELLGI